MMWFFAVLIVLAMGGVALLAAGKGAPLAEEFGDRPDSLAPADRRIRGEDLRRVRFSLAFRGYRMSEVDALLDRMARELEAAEDAGAADSPAQQNPTPGGEKGPDPEPSPDAAPEPAGRWRRVVRRGRSRRTVPAEADPATPSAPDEHAAATPVDGDAPAP